VPIRHSSCLFLFFSLSLSLALALSLSLSLSLYLSIYLSIFLSFFLSFFFSYPPFLKICAVVFCALLRPRASNHAAVINPALGKSGSSADPLLQSKDISAKIAHSNSDPRVPKDLQSLSLPKRWLRVGGFRLPNDPRPLETPAACSNAVYKARYNLVTFLPLFLFAQFSRLLFLTTLIMIIITITMMRTVILLLFTVAIISRLALPAGWPISTPSSSSSSPASLSLRSTAPAACFRWR
jgi:hypothetical protein